MINIARSLIEKPEYIPLERFEHKHFKGEIICSGSSGNMTIIDETICFDAGVKVKVVKGLKLDVLAYTHRHGDHLQLAALRKIIKTNPNILILCNADTHQKIIDAGIIHKMIIVIKSNDVYNLEIKGKKYKFTIVQMSHDVECHGYILENEYNEKLLYATDTTTLDYIQKDIKFDVILAEANYCLKKIKTMINVMKPQHRARLNENLSRHLSRQDNRLFAAKHANKDFYSYDMHKSGQFY